MSYRYILAAELSKSDVKGSGLNSGEDQMQVVWWYLGGVQAICEHSHEAPLRTSSMQA